MFCEGLQPFPFEASVYRKKLTFRRAALEELASGEQRPTWSIVASDVDCEVQPAGSPSLGNRVATGYAEAWTIWTFDRNLVIEPQDRTTINGAACVIDSVDDHGNFLRLHASPLQEGAVGAT